MLYFAFYKARYGNWIDWGIAARTWSRYSHVEVSFANPVNADQQLKHALCFSASPRDGGTRFTTIDLTSDHWEVLQINWIDRKRARAFCEAQNGLKYDVRGVLSFICPLIKPAKDHWFCSEICSAICQDQGYKPPKEPRKMSPEDLFSWLAQYKHIR